MSERRPMQREHGPLTRGSWFHLGRSGGPCDRACPHCFYHGLDDLVFYDAATLLYKANRFRHYYGLTSTDITGGEATIYRDPALDRKGLKPLRKGGRNEQLEYLVRHCANIGLAPSIITHGQNLSEPLVKAIEDCGLDTWEISIHGLGKLDGQQLGDGHRLLVVRHDGCGREGDFQQMLDGVSFCTQPIRWNSTVVEPTYKELPGVARFLVDRYPAFVYNMIFFMPYYKHTEVDSPIQVKYTDAAPYIAEAVAIVEDKGWECNVRYFPPCIGHEYGFGRNCIMHHQIQRDPWEWAYEATTMTQLPIPWSAVQGGLATEEVFWEQAERMRTRQCGLHARSFQPYNPPCAKCAAKHVCEGSHVQYAKRYGSDELRPFSSETLGLPADAMTFDPNVFETLPAGAPEKEMVMA